MASQPSLYEPLDRSKREIRLLKLAEGSSENEDDLRFEMRQFPLDKLYGSFWFTALSYRQGIGNPPRQIYVNDMLYPPHDSTLEELPPNDAYSKQLPPNLYTYLKQFKIEHNPSWLFVDAICINQNDSEEVSSQILLMGDIYRQAGLVIAWLGVEGDKSGFQRLWPGAVVDDAFLSTFWTKWEPRVRALCRERRHQITKLNEDAANVDEHAEDSRDLEGDVESPEEHVTDVQGDEEDLEEELKEIQAATGARIDARELQVTVLCTAFFNWEYWSRSWIVQEVLLPVNLMFQFRSVQASENFLQQFASKVRVRRPDAGPEDEGDQLADNPDSIHRFRQKYIRSGETPPIQSVYGLNLWQCFIGYRERTQSVGSGSRFLPFKDALSATGGQECVKSYDKIFGFLGLTKSSIIPDYNMPRTELFLWVLLEGLLDIGGYITGEIGEQHRKVCCSVWTAFGVPPVDQSVAFFTTESLRMCSNEFTDLQYMIMAFDYDIIIRLREEVLPSPGGIPENKAYLQAKRNEAARTHESELQLPILIEQDALLKGIEGDDREQKASIWRQRILEVTKSIICKQVGRMETAPQPGLHLLAQAK